MALHSGHCNDHAPRPTQDTRSRRFRGRLLVALGLLTLTAAVGLLFNALGASRNSPGDVEWKADDEVALMATVGLSWVFVLIGLVINARQTKMTDALASAQIEERTRRMQYASFLSLKAVGNCSLEVAHNALAVLPTYNLAAQNDQLRFLNSLVKCYGTLALDSFPHNHRLPLAERTQLRSATKELQDGLLQFATQRPNRHLRHELVEAAEALRVALDLEDWYVGDKTAPTLTAGDLRRLYANELQSYCCWADPITRLVQTEAAPAEGAVADARVPGLAGHVERCHVGSARHYLSPWYLTDVPPLQKPDGSGLQPNESQGDNAEELSSAGHAAGGAGAPGPSPSDTITLFEVDYSGFMRPNTAPLVRKEPFPRLYPSALSHDDVATVFPEFRRHGIDRIDRILREANIDSRPASVPILTYRTAAGPTIVLDGNHRLAALLREEKEKAAPEPGLIVFRLQEAGEEASVAAVAPTRHTPEDNHDHTWVGFNPDVCLAKNPEAVRARRAGSSCEQADLERLSLVRRSTRWLRQS